MLGEKGAGHGERLRELLQAPQGKRRSPMAPVGLEAGERMAAAGREARSCCHPYPVPWFGGGSTQPLPQPLPLARLLLAPFLPQVRLRLQQRPEKHRTKTTLAMRMRSTEGWFWTGRFPSFQSFGSPQPVLPQDTSPGAALHGAARILQERGKRLLPARTPYNTSGSQEKHHHLQRKGTSLTEENANTVITVFLQSSGLRSWMSLGKATRFASSFKLSPSAPQLLPQTDSGAT